MTYLDVHTLHNKVYIINVLYQLLRTIINTKTPRRSRGYAIVIHPIGPSPSGEFIRTEVTYSLFAYRFILAQR